MNTGNIGYLREKFLNFDPILDLNLTLQFEIALFRLVFVEIRWKVSGFCLNNRFLRERGMASNPKMEYQVFLCIFQKNSAVATLGLKEMGKFL